MEVLFILEPCVKSEKLDVKQGRGDEQVAKAKGKISLSLGNGVKFFDFSFNVIDYAPPKRIIFVGRFFCPILRKEVEADIFEVLFDGLKEIKGSRNNYGTLYSQAFLASKPAMVLLVGYILSEVKKQETLAQFKGLEDLAILLYREEIIPEICEKIMEAIGKIENHTSPENQLALKILAASLGIEKDIKPLLLKDNKK